MSLNMLIAKVLHIKIKKTGQLDGIRKLASSTIVNLIVISCQSSVFSR